MVDSDQLDFLLSSSAGDTLHDQNKTFWVSRPLFQERYALIYGNRLANALGAGPADLSLLKDEYFVTMAQNDRKDVLFSDITFPLCMNAGYFPKVYCKTDEFLVKVKLVQSDLAVAVLPESCLKSLPCPCCPASSIRCWKTRWQNEPSISCVIKKAS